MEKKATFLLGLRQGVPICLAYLAVSFTFGLAAVRGGLPAWLATLISATNITSAGQFAGINLIMQGAGFLEVALAVFVINSRYMLMSLSLSQQLDKRTGTLKRLVMSLFVTDEIFAVATTQGEGLNFKYFLGLATMPYLGWTVGTLMGGLINSVLPTSLQNALGIALYCMFIAIVLPPAKKSKAVLVCVALSAAITCVFYYVPVLSEVSLGFRTIIASVLSAVITALIFPIKDKKEDSDIQHSDTQNNILLNSGNSDSQGGNAQ